MTSCDQLEKEAPKMPKSPKTRNKYCQKKSPNIDQKHTYILQN